MLSITITYSKIITSSRDMERSQKLNKTKKEHNLQAYHFFGSTALEIIRGSPISLKLYKLGTVLYSYLMLIVD